MAVPHIAATTTCQDRLQREMQRQMYGNLDSKSGALASSLTQKIRRSKGDAHNIMAIVRQAEASGMDQCLFNKLLDEAMSSFGPVAVKLAFEDYCDLCAKRLQLLCALDPKEASLFAKFLKKKSFCQKDARVHCVQAELELRAGQPAAAIKVLEDALTMGAAPAETLQAMLSRLLEVSGTPEVGFKATAAPAAASSSLGDNATPVRPRALRYSGGFVAPIAEDLGREGLSCTASAVGSGSNESLSSERARRSSLDNLSPVVEADSVERSLLKERAASFADGSNPNGWPRTTAAVAAPPCAVMPDSAGNVVAGNGSEDGSSSSSSDGVIDADPSETTLNAVDASAGEARHALKPIVVNGIPYIRQKTIGRGGSSKVYLVKDSSGSLFALKRVSTKDRSHFEALANEVTLLRQLKDCPHVIQVLDTEVVPDRGLIQIVMERGDVDLKHFLESEQNLTLGEIQILWRQILEAVHVIHTERIVHSDLKPANFLLVDGRLKLIDFGIAKCMSSETTHISREASVGTISYMAPEAVKPGSVKLGRSSDIWSIGIILYQMVYEHAPFAHLEPMQRIFTLTDPNMAMSFPPEHCLEGHSENTKSLLIDVLEQCLQRDPRHRPSIPQLLQHPFLHDSMSITRCVFDRTLQALVTGFCEAAGSTSTMKAEASKEDSAAGDAKKQIESPRHHQWQLLADEVWDRMSKSEGGRLRKRRANNQAEGNGAADMLGVAPFQNVLRHWMGRSECKRQRVADVGSEALQAPSERLRAARPKLTSRPPPPPPRGKAPPQKSSAPFRLPARADGATAGLCSVNVSNASSTRRDEKAAIHADLLQQQRAVLKKVVQGSARVDKENSGPNTNGNGGCTMSEENPVLRRLKERRCVVADERTEEMTQTTGWLDTPMDE